MKFATLFVLLAVMLVAVCAMPKRGRPKLPPPSGNPHFGGYGSFNPRGRRSPGGKITIDQPVNGKPSIDGTYSHQVYGGKYGTVDVYGGGSMGPNQKPQGNAGIHAEINLGGNGGGGGGYSARDAEIDRIRKEAGLN